MPKNPQNFKEIGYFLDLTDVTNVTDVVPATPLRLSDIFLRVRLGHGFLRKTAEKTGGKSGIRHIGYISFPIRIPSVSEVFLDLSEGSETPLE